MARNCKQTLVLTAKKRKDPQKNGGVPPPEVFFYASAQNSGAALPRMASTKYTINTMMQIMRQVLPLLHA